MGSVALDRTAESAAGPTAGVRTGPRPPSFRFLKATIWLYLLFWIFEGAVRKWIYPPSGNYLALGKDVILVVAYLAAFRAKVFPRNNVVWGALLLGFAAGFVGFFFQGVPYSILIYGFLAYIFPFPFIFLIPRVFSSKDTRRVLQFLLWLSIPMVLLMLVQFSSPPGSFVNAVVGQDEYTTKTEVVAGSRVRPSGTWTYVSPNSLYFMTLFSVLIGQAMQQVALRPSLLAFATATIVATVISKSRTQLYGMALVVGQYVLLFGRQLVRRIHYLLLLVAFLSAGTWYVLGTELGRSGIEEFNSRMEQDVRTGGQSIISRLQYNYWPDAESISQSGLVGYGMGMGTTAAGLVLVGRRVMFLHESEITRIIQEFGWIGGAALVLLRLSVIGVAFRVCLRQMRKRNYWAVGLFLPWWQSFLFSTWGTPALNMYNVVFAGLILAAGNLDEGR